MNKLLRVELSRRLTSIIYIGEIILLLVYNFLEISGSTYGFEVNIPYFLFNKTTLICIFISINVSLKLSQELDNRTINNKLFCGYNKSTFYKTELLVGIIEGTLLLLADTISVILLGIFQNYELNISYIDLFINFIIALIIISTVAIISTILSVLINNRIFSIFIVNLTFRKFRRVRNQRQTLHPIFLVNFIFSLISGFTNTFRTFQVINFLYIKFTITINIPKIF